MSLRKLVFVSLLALCPALASTINVVNSSFEALPIDGLPFVCPGTNCSFSNTDVPGWTFIGTSGGQFQPGNPVSNIYYDMLMPNGITVAYLNSGSLSQTTSATVVQGRTYTLMVDVGNRKDLCCTINSVADLVFLSIGGTNYAATGVLASPGMFSTLTVSYTGLLADVGKSVGVLLSPTRTGQVNFDNVRLSDDAFVITLDAPEPSTMAFMAAGLGLLGLLGRKRN